MSCDFAHHDGAYVLGALSPADRSAFERHLADCSDCARSVREFAGLPGLLGRVSPAVLEPEATPVPVPSTLFPALVTAARRSQRRRTTVMVGLAAAGALIVAGGSTVVLKALEDPPAAAPARTMVSVGSGSMSATLALTSVAWGTRLELVCTYADRTDWYGAKYAMVVRTRDGRVEQVATWKALPGKSMRLPAATSLARDDITSVDVLTADGHAVLTLQE